MLQKTYDTFKPYIPSWVNADELIRSFEQPSPTSIRINPNKIKKPLNATRVPWSEYGYYLNSRPKFTLDPVFHAGGYYVQEASSMCIESIIRPLCSRPLKVLDVCAAPGGKSTHIISLLERGSLLISNETIRSRAHILSENMIKWGKSNCIITNNDPKDFNFLPGFFDVILVDAPCSGEGMFRKNPHALSEWSPEHITFCSKRQTRILHDIWDCLAPNGILIYSTCTFNEQENEDVLYEFTKQKAAESIPITVNPKWNIIPHKKHTIYSYRFFPHTIMGEGFSMSVLRKTDGVEYTPPKRLPKSPITIINERNKLKYSQLIKNYKSIVFESKPNILWAFAKDYRKLLIDVYAHCNVIHAGIPLVEIIRHKLNPLPGLALANSYNNTILTHIEVDLETALRYFKKEALVLKDAPKGWVQINYKQIPLGFVKNIGNRANNPYPASWSIKMDIQKENMWSISDFFS